MTARPATKVRESERPRPIPPLSEPSERSLRAASMLSERLKHRAAKVRLDFIRCSTPGPPPPLAVLLRGGSGGEVRLKLFLSLLWVAGGGIDERHKTNAYPARAWAALLDLPDPEGKGQRRIRDAIGWLEEQQLINIDREPGRPMALQLRRDDGSGKPYTDPAGAHKKGTSKQPMNQHDYFVLLPETFWTEGWIVSLSARAIAMLLVIAEMTFSPTREFEWVSPSRARQIYGISEDTWSKGIAELRARKIIVIRKQPVGEDDFDFRRVRNTYKLQRTSNKQIALPARAKTA
jgi:hypothetical protein